MRQVAALPYRLAGAPGMGVEVLLVTSSRGRWIIPKGDVDGNMAPHHAAEKEAFEEGGVRGRVDSRALGTFASSKEQGGASIQLDVEVFPLEVTEELERWPEMDQRERRWLPVGEAAKAVTELELATMIRAFRPR